MAENIFEIAYIVLGVITLLLGGILPDRFYSVYDSESVRKYL